MFFCAFSGAQRVIMLAESWAIHAGWLRERPGDYSASSRRKLMSGAFLSAGDYVAAQQRRNALIGAVDAVFRDVETPGEGGQVIHEQVFDHFEQVAPGRLSAAEFDGFVRDTVNFLDYVSEPTQTARRALGVWVVLFLLVFTWLAWLVYREYWKDVH